MKGIFKMLYRGVRRMAVAGSLATLSALALAACGQKADKADEASEAEIAEVPSVEEVTEDAAEAVVLSAEEALARAESFMADNASAEGVQVQESGLHFKSLTAGTGDAAGEEDFVTVHYTGKLIDGTVFDSSRERGEPITFNLQQVIPGWREGILLMNEGETARFFLPPALAYGEAGAGELIGPNEALVFDVELIEVIAATDTERLNELQAEAEARAREAFEKIAKENADAAEVFLAANAQKEGIQTTESGLQYQVLSRGEGTGQPGATDTVEVHYRGTLLDGTEFDSSYNRGETISFALDGVIPGWTEGVQLMREGDKFRFFLPPELGYGEMGTGPGGPIGPNEALIFEVELVAVK